MNCKKSSNDTAILVENIVGDDGYVDWDDEMDYKEGCTYEDVNLIDSSLNPKNIWIMYEVKVLEYLPNNGNSPFNKTIIKDICNTLLLTESSSDDILSKVDFFNGEYSYSSMKPYVKEIFNELSKNDILSKTVSIATDMGISVIPTNLCIPRSESESELELESDPESLISIQIDQDILNKSLEYSLTYSYVLHILTHAMYYDRTILQKMYDHVMYERNHGRLIKLKDNVNMFLYFKKKNLYKAIKVFLHQKQKVSKKTQQTNQTQQYSALGQFALSLNVLEAMTQDYKTGYTYNAESAYELALLDGLFDYTTDVNKKRLKLNSMGSMYSSTSIPRNWTDLYQSWNMCFVYNQYGNHPLFMAKLLNPAVGNYTDDPSIYMTPRVIALYIHIFRMMVVRNVDSSPNPNYFKPEKIDWRIKNFSNIWGRVNYIYAKKYRKFYDDLSKKTGHSSFFKINSLADGFINLTWKGLKLLVDNGNGQQEEEFIKLVEKYRKIKMKKNMDYGIKRKLHMQMREKMDKSYDVFSKVDKFTDKLNLL